MIEDIRSRIHNFNNILKRKITDNRLEITTLDNYIINNADSYELLECIDILCDTIEEITNVLITEKDAELLNMALTEMKLELAECIS